MAEGRLGSWKDELVYCVSFERPDDDLMEDPREMQKAKFDKRRFMSRTWMVILGMIECLSSKLKIFSTQLFFSKKKKHLTNNRYDSLFRLHDFLEKNF